MTPHEQAAKAAEALLKQLDIGVQGHWAFYPSTTEALAPLLLPFFSRGARAEELLARTVESANDPVTLWDMILTSRCFLSSPDAVEAPKDNRAKVPISVSNELITQDRDRLLNELTRLRAENATLHHQRDDANKVAKEFAGKWSAIQAENARLREGLSELCNSVEDCRNDGDRFLHDHKDKMLEQARSILGGAS